MRKYLAVVVTRHDGSTFFNPLKLSEVSKVSLLAQDHKLIQVCARVCTLRDYNLIFGKVKEKDGQ